MVPYMEQNDGLQINIHN